MTKNQHSEPDYLRIVLIALVVLLVILGLFLVQQYLVLRREKLIGMHRAWLTSLYENHAPLPANDATDIRPWMTFNYINKVFGISSSTLKVQLGITDPRYPQLSISGWANETHASSSAATDQVVKAIEEALAPQPI